MTLPSPEALFENLRIELCANEHSPWADTDRIGGFFQLRTADYYSPDHPFGAYAGYTYLNQRLLKDFFWLKNGNLLDRRQAKKILIEPHQITHEYKDGSRESLMVLPEQAGILISLRSAQPADFDFCPAFARQDVITTPQNHGVQLHFAGPGIDLFMLATPPALWKNITASRNKAPKNLKLYTDLPGALEFKASQNIDLVCLFSKNQQQVQDQAPEILLHRNTWVENKKESIAGYVLQSFVETGDADYNRAMAWAKISGHALLVNEFGLGIWAGLPWFNQNWGRDTFIALPGLCLVTGAFDKARTILNQFAAYQKTDPHDPLFGRLPNRVVSPQDIIYNTADGTPWFARELAETCFYSGDRHLAHDLFPVLQRAINGNKKNFMDSTGFLTHDDADTWMDARIRGDHAWSPRGNRGVEIQALWITQLRTGAALARSLGYEKEARDWAALADFTARQFRAHFIDKKTGLVHDHLDADGSKNRQLRPNALFAVTVPMFGPLLPQKNVHTVVSTIVKELVYPHGVGSLSQYDDAFHPYHHDQIYHFDAAYHNGLCWHWLAGPAVSGLVKINHTDLAFQLTKNLSDQILSAGMPGSLSELTEPFLTPDKQVKPSGTYSQAWSVSEFIRTLYQDFLGIRPNMLERCVTITPAIPRHLGFVRARIRIGKNECFDIHFDAKNEKFSFHAVHLYHILTVRMHLLDSHNRMYKVELALEPGKQCELVLIDRDEMVVQIGTTKKHMICLEQKRPDVDPDLSFARPHPRAQIKSLIQPDYLEKKILSKP